MTALYMAARDVPPDRCLITWTIPEIPERLGSETAVSLCPRLAWAAKIAEFEWIEVRNLTRQTRHEAYVIFGREEKVEWWAFPESTVQTGDALQLSVYAWGYSAPHLAEDSARLRRAMA